VSVLDKTMSAMPLLVHCAAPANPATWLAGDRTNDAARVGNAVHLLAQWWIEQKTPDVAKACDVEGVRAIEFGRVERLFEELRSWMWPRYRSTWRAEVAFAYAPISGEARILGYGINGQYEKHGKRPDEMAGTVDILDNGELLTVDDIKTGKSSAESYRWQMRTLGLAAARAFERKRARIRVIRVSEVEVDDSWSEELDAEDLDSAADIARDVWTSAPTALPKAGAHCVDHYCRGREKCAAFQEWRANP